MKKTIFIILLSLVLSILFFVSCSEDRNTRDSDPHPTGWGDPNSANFHGHLAACDDCHTSNFATSPAAVSCRSCHASAEMSDPHPAGWGDSTSANFHGDLGPCQNCHGAQFQTGSLSASCRQCHDQPSEALVACGTCHAVPPVSDAGLPVGMPQGANAFGAHEFHWNWLQERSLECTECHLQRHDEMIAHVDSLPAELNFAHATLAKARNFPADSVVHIGAANSGNATCAVYCHSNGHGGAPNMGWLQWTQQDVTFTCNSCHSAPPALPHPQVTSCWNCHSNVDPTSQYPNNIRFINPQLHIDGIVEL